VKEKKSFQQQIKNTISTINYKKFLIFCNFGKQYRLVITQQNNRIQLTYATPNEELFIINFAGGGVYMHITMIQLREFMI